jgi:hypothetical protein
MRPIIICDSLGMDAEPPWESRSVRFWKTQAAYAQVCPSKVVGQLPRNFLGALAQEAPLVLLAAQLLDVELQ